jgi:hypothetical protein
MNTPISRAPLWFDSSCVFVLRFGSVPSAVFFSRAFVCVGRLLVFCWSVYRQPSTLYSSGTPRSTSSGLASASVALVRLASIAALGSEVFLFGMAT